MEVPAVEDFHPFRNDRKKVIEAFEKAYLFKPVPKMDIPHEPNMALFLKALKQLFPNVKDVYATAVALQNWTQSFRDRQCGDSSSGSKDLSQYLLYLYSENTGGTGKTTTASLLQEWVEKNGGTSSSCTGFGGGYFDPKNSSTTLSSCQTSK